MNTFDFQWHVTDRCGNRCKHCYLGGSRNKVSIVMVRRIIADITDCCEQLEARPIIAITGGDPLTHPDIKLILEAVRKISSWLGVLGNPELLNNETIKMLEGIGINQYQLSIDGMEKTHDEIRRKGSFMRTIKAIEMLLKTSIHVRIMSTVSSINYKEMADVMKTVYGLGVKKWSFARWIPETGDCGLTPQQYKDFLGEIVAEQKPFRDKGIILPVNDPLIVPFLGESVVGDTTSILGGCSLGSSKLCILPDNVIMGCRRNRDSILGKWKKRGDLLNLFLFNPKMEEYRKIKEIEKCNRCSFLNQCRGCRAAAFASVGNTFGKDPQCFM